MKLKLDENIDPRAKGILAEAGHDVLSVADQKLSGSADKTVAAVIRHEGRCLVTLDMDFADVIAYPPGRYMGLVVLNHPRPTAKGLLGLIRQLAVSLRSGSPRGHLWIVEPGRLRVREKTED